MRLTTTRVCSYPVTIGTYDITFCNFHTQFRFRRNNRQIGYLKFFIAPVIEISAAHSGQSGYSRSVSAGLTHLCKMEESNRLELIFS
jgi:hypothetical protein